METWVDQQEIHEGRNRLPTDAKAHFARSRRTADAGEINWQSLGRHRAITAAGIRLSKEDAVAAFNKVSTLLITNKKGRSPEANR
jgi:hypothetical protein